MKSKCNVLNKYSIYIKLFFCLVVIGFSALNSFTNLLVVESETICMKDKMINETSQLFEYLTKKENSTIRKTIMITLSLLLDLSLIFSIYSWIFKIKSWRPIINLILFFLFKFINELIFTLQEDKNMFWEYPGFPSIIITYKTQSNSYYSGVIGIYVIITTELLENSQKILGSLNTISMVVYIILTISLRKENFLSIVSGLISAHYFYFIAKKYSYIIDSIYLFEDPSPRAFERISAGNESDNTT